MNINPLHVELAKLRQRNDELEDEVAALKLQLANEDNEINKGQIRLRAKYGLSNKQSLFLSFLADGRVKEINFLMDMLCEKDVWHAILCVWKCKINKKISPLKIQCRRGVGYYLEGDTLQKIQSVMRGEDDRKTTEKLTPSNGTIRGGVEVTNADGGWQREPQHNFMSRC